MIEGMTRRAWFGAGIGLGCGATLLTRAALAESPTEVPSGYTKPEPITDFTKAPGARHTKVRDGYVFSFADGDDILSGLTGFATVEKIGAARISAIGGFKSALFGWYDLDRKAYKDIPIAEQVEVTGLLGNIALVEGAPYVHLHGSVSNRSGDLTGGHLLHAIASPVLELFVEVLPDPLLKKKNDENGLNEFDFK